MLEPVGIPVPVAAYAPASWSLFGVQLSERVIAAGRATSGGDWCEAFVVTPGVIALSIGDVCGHGEGKFQARVAIRERIRVAARRGLDPARILTAAHDFLHDYDPDEYATAIFGLLDVENRSFVFANAAHPAPLLCVRAEATYLEFDDTDLPLGVLEDTPPLRCVEIPEAALLVLYTDGVTEHDRRPLQGASELRDAALFAYDFQSLPTAGVIQREMGLSDGNHDDAAILTARMPRTFRHSAPDGR